MAQQFIYLGLARLCNHHPASTKHIAIQQDAVNSDKVSSNLPN
jgi:hypothetical protein